MSDARAWLAHGKCALARAASVSLSLVAHSVPALVAALAAVALLPPPFAVAANDERAPLRFRYRDGSSERIATRELASAEYVSINDVSRLFSAVKYWDADTFQMELALGGGRVQLTLGNPVVMLNEEPILLAGAIEMFDGVLWAPLDLVTQHLARLGSKRVAWVEPLREFRVAGARANIDRVRVERDAAGASVRIAIAEPLAASVELKASVLTIAWPEAVLPEEALALEDPSRMVDSMTAFARDEGAELRLSLSAEFSGVSVEARETPPATVVRIVARADTTRAPGRESDASRAEGEWDDREEDLEADTFEPAVPTIVIDPGHGGLDDGVVGRSGLREKDAALELAQALRTRLEDGIGARVILTREDDESVPPERRATIANTSDADLFVSLHCNAASDLEASGFEAYVYRAEERAPAMTAAAVAAIGQPGSSPDRFEGDETPAPAGDSRAEGAELTLLPWRFVQAPFTARSRRLAETLCEAAGGVPGVANRGVQTGGVLELAGARMPAVHLEVGFLTNPDDEARLASEEFRAKLAGALARGIEAFVSARAPDEASLRLERDMGTMPGAESDPSASASAPAPAAAADAP